MQEVADVGGGTTLCDNLENAMQKLKFIRPKPVEIVLMGRIRDQSVAQKESSLIEEWNSKNLYGPELFGPGSGHPVIWTCDQGHVYTRPIAGRVRSLSNTKRNKNGCPICAGRIPEHKDSLERHPELALEWCSFKNRRKPSEVRFDSDLLASWRCRACSLVFCASVNARTQGENPQGCPACCDHPRVDLSRFPQASQQFDRSNNVGFEPRNLPEDHMVLWVCKAGHKRYTSFTELQASEWQCSECQRLNNKHFLSDYPEVVKQLVDDKVDPSKLRAGSHKELKWHCDQAPITSGAHPSTLVRLPTRVARSAQTGSCHRPIALKISPTFIANSTHLKMDF